MFSAGEMEVKLITDLAAKELKKRGYSPMVILAYLTVLPLLLEHKAIAEYVRLNPHLRGALPEVLTRSEAVNLMSQDLMLSETDATELMKLLPETLDLIAELWTDPIRNILAA